MYISWELNPNGKFNTLNLLRQNLLFENKYNPDSKSDSRNESTPKSNRAPLQTRIPPKDHVQLIWLIGCSIQEPQDFGPMVELTEEQWQIFFH